MQDEKGTPQAEEPPKKPDYDRYFKESGANAREMFNALVLAYGGRDPELEKKLAALASERGNIYSVGVGVLRNPTGNTLAVSAQLVAQALVMAALKMGWPDMLSKLIVEAYDRRKGHPVVLVSAFAGAIERGLGDDIASVVEGLLNDEKNYEACGLVASLEDAAFSKRFMGKLMELIDSEDEAKLQALFALAPLAETEPEAKELFSTLLDDWEEEARIASAKALANVKDDKIAEKALDIVPEERNPHLRFHLYRILENNRDHAVKVLCRELETGGESAREAITVLVRIEKKERLKAIAREMKERAPGAAEMLEQAIG